MPTRLRHFADDLLRHILVHVRRDRLGNETVPGLIFEARVWRRLGKRFLALSRDTPSKFDAHIAYTKDGVLPRSFAGGLGCSPSLDLDCFAFAFLELFLLRTPHTGRVWAVCVDALGHAMRSPTDNGNKDRFVYAVLVLRHLVQLLSGQNADFDTRLDHFDKVVAGLNVRKTPAEYFGVTLQFATGFLLDPFRGRESPATEIDCLIRWDLAGTRLCNELRMGVGTYAANMRLAVEHGALRNDDKRYPKLPPISILLGFYDHPKVAECGAMQVSIHTHRLPKALLPKPKANDPELHLRILGRAALDRAERIASERTALVVRCYRHGVLVNARSGPSGVPSRRPRDAAINARDGIRAGVQADNDTLTSGRLKFVKQLADDESREAEAVGLVDDQYASLDEERDEPILYDSDGAYDDRAPKRSKRVMAQERRAEVLAEVLAEEHRRSRAWMIPSDDEDDGVDAIEDL